MPVVPQKQPLALDGCLRLMTISGTPMPHWPLPCRPWHLPPGECYGDKSNQDFSLSGESKLGTNLESLGFKLEPCVSRPCVHDKSRIQAIGEGVPCE